MLNDLYFLDGLQEDYLQEVKDFIDEWFNDSEFISVSTSGSTGEPKIVKISKEIVKRSAHATGQFFDFEKGQKILLNLSPKYIAGKLMIVRAMEHRMDLVVGDLSSDPLLKCDKEISFAAFVPSQIEEILSNPESKEKLKKIQNVIIGGSPLHPSLENELSSFTNNNYVTFGMTETVTHFALRKVGTPIYKCLDGFEISTDDRSCLVIKANQIVQETLITNDVIDLVDESTFKWRGRADFVINSGGVKIFPEKVEKMIAHLLPNNKFYVTSKADEKFGEIVILLIEGQADTQLILEQTKSFLPKYHEPKEVYLKGAFNYTETGKIIREKY
ncbi:MAG: O-succinylbenzoic acid--CoA ligase [Arenicella sp.]|jgi:O-succinylbenzoic acid--CoA ligase